MNALKMKYFDLRSIKLKLYNFRHKEVPHKHNYKTQGDIDKGCGDFTIHIKSYTNIPRVHTENS